LSGCDPQRSDDVLAGDVVYGLDITSMRGDIFRKFKRFRFHWDAGFPLRVLAKRATTR